MQSGSASKKSQQQARAYVPSVYVPQNNPPAYAPHVQPSAPPGSPNVTPASSSTSSNNGLWECDTCTFINKQHESICKACHTARPSNQAPSYQASQQPYVPSSSQQQQYSPQPPATQSYVYHPPAQAPVPLPKPYVPQSSTQSSTMSQTSNNVDSNMQTFRVLIPSGMQPGQQIRVETGSTNPPPTIVTIPTQNSWGRTPDGKSYFDVQLRKEAPAVIQGSFVSPSYSNTNAGGSYTQTNQYTPGHSQATYNPSHSQAGPQAPSHSVTMSTYQAPVSSSSSRAVIWPEHVTLSAKTLVLKEQSMSYSGDDAQIKDTNGNIVFYVHAELMTMSQRRYLVDTRGQKIGQLRHKKTPGLHPTVYIGTTSNEKKSYVKMSGMLNPVKCDASVYVDDKKIGKVSGNWRAKKFTITIDGSVAANVLRKRTMSSIFMGADTYCIDIQPGADVAFISLIAIALDELYNDERGGRQGGGGIGGSFGPGW